MMQVVSSFTKKELLVTRRLRLLNSHHRIFTTATYSLTNNMKDKDNKDYYFSKKEKQQLSFQVYHRFKSSSSLINSNNDKNTVEFLQKREKNSIPFLLADIGEGITEVEILQWYVTPGDTVKQFDRICEVQSDKATVEITSRYDGRIESLSKDDIVKVGLPLVHINIDIVEEDAAAAEEEELKTSSNTPSIIESLPVQQQKQEEQEQRSSYHNVNAITTNNKEEEENNLSTQNTKSTAISHSSKSKILATPAVRKFISDQNININGIVGSGPNGRVLKSDVLQQQQTKDDDIHHNHHPIRGYHRIMVKTMEESLSIPHMCYGDEVNMNKLLKIVLQSQNIVTTKLSILPFVIKAVSLAIQDYPILNSSIIRKTNNDDTIMMMKYHCDHNIGIAMDTTRGLLVPVIKSCQNLSILDIAQELKRLKEVTSSNSTAINKDDLSGATFTFSNIGAVGGTYMSPIVASPQVAIGAMGKIQRLPRFVSSSSLEIEEANIARISWAADHRAIDGATLAKFSNQWKNYVENPSSMLLSLK